MMYVVAKADEQKKSSSKKCGGFQKLKRGCGDLVKEHRSRFYILRRCITMLLCWKDCTADT
nr:putative DVL [Ipomoea batatas]GMC54704.1 putative DVL [Ipomoea batatas]GMD04154.1 putative DVL [Ipomoea batatas]GME10249.1 putative DVL [Ipomoea batatas]